ncbi:MAG TPA: hypothetical protein VNL96_08425 [Gemmatimonadaceae bacterium]|nr:hypothetical protein [Gemmatimonadaceae bacterium]
MKGKGLVLAVLLCLPNATSGQVPDTTLVQGGLYQRPFIFAAGRTAVGGYLESNFAWWRSDGIAEGPSFEVRRFNVFLFSALGSRLRFLSELEFEHGTEEIALETALVDFVITPSLVLRAGVLLPPIGAFNVNHDGPRYDFVERPLVSTEIVPATLSEVGFGLHGRLLPAGATLSYDLYVTNGLGSGIVLNETGRTHLASGKGPALFAEDENDSPAFSGRVALHVGRWGELGLSLYRGIYNTWRVEGEKTDDPRWVGLSALDITAALGRVQLRAEAARASVDLPVDLREILGDRQWGFYLDAILPLWRPRLAALPDAKVDLGLRLEQVDYNVGRFASTGLRRFDDRRAAVIAVAFRPASGTVFKLNYRLERERDLFGNPAQRRAALQLGVATYF